MWPGVVDCLSLPGNSLWFCLAHIKDMLVACCAADNWSDHLPWVLLGLHSAAREGDNTTPAQAVFCSPLILPGVEAATMTKFFIKKTPSAPSHRVLSPVYTAHCASLSLPSYLPISMYPLRRPSPSLPALRPRSLFTIWE